jgi:hypothetical protein
MNVQMIRTVTGTIVDSDGARYPIARFGHIVVVAGWSWSYEAYEGVTAEFLATYAKIPGAKKIRVARAVAVANWLSESYPLTVRQVHVIRPVAP